MVYSRKKIQQKIKDLFIIMSENQSESQNEGPSNDSGNSSPNVISYSPPSDLDIPIAIRKGTRTRTCTQHPITKYLSYHRLSKNIEYLLLMYPTYLFQKPLRKLLVTRIGS